MPLLLLVAVFVIATCGLIYELVAGTLASYLLGDSVMQFSTIIGVYLFAMGIGSFLSRYFSKNLLAWFIRIEFLVSLVGGFSAALLFVLFPLIVSFQVPLYLLVLITGILVGLEIPLLMRILKNKVEFKELVSQVFTFDYIGALLASVIFPLLLVPHLGLIRTSLMFGILNALVGLILCFKFGQEIPRPRVLKMSAVLVILLQLVAFVYSDRIMDYSETLAYNDNVIYSTSSPYQRIVITNNKKELRLFLNGNLQFSSYDEYRYHEALVHPVMASVQQPKKILVLGGGDGLAVREILKYPSVESVQLVDLDPAMTNLFSSNPVLCELNKRSLLDPRVKIANADAFSWIKKNEQRFDVVIIDFPDPSNFSVGKLYTNTFYRLVAAALAENGAGVVQSTSPFVAPKSYWCINKTLQSAGFNTIPYHNYVPSFGEWGYTMITKNGNAVLPATRFMGGLKFLNSQTMQQMLVFPDDMTTRSELAVNKLNNQQLVEYFEAEWNAYLQQ
ncbi:MAG: polyamine aminopropyltransferase [Ferruginibacter sp.]